MTAEGVPKNPSSTGTSDTLQKRKQTKRLQSENNQQKYQRKIIENHGRTKAETSQARHVRVEKNIKSIAGGCCRRRAAGS